MNVLKNKLNFSKICMALLTSSYLSLSACYFKVKTKALEDQTIQAPQDTTVNPNIPVPTPTVEEIFNKNIPMEFVSNTSSVYQETAIRKYKVISSAGSYHQEIFIETPSNYKIYLSSQGVLMSEHIYGGIQ